MWYEKYQMEPILLQHFIHQKVSKLSTAVAQIPTGNALVYTLYKPKSLFIGTVPRQCSVIWHYPDHEELQVFSSGCTFFTWKHVVEVVVVTGLVMYKFELSSNDMFVVFHVFNPIRLCSSIAVDEIHDKMENMIKTFMKGHEDDAFGSPEFLSFKSEMFFALNRTFQNYGIAINALYPRVRLEHA